MLRFANFVNGLLHVGRLFRTLHKTSPAGCMSLMTVLATSRVITPPVQVVQPTRLCFNVIQLSHSYAKRLTALYLHSFTSVFTPEVPGALQRPAVSTFAFLCIYTCLCGLSFAQVAVSTFTFICIYTETAKIACMLDS